MSLTPDNLNKKISTVKKWIYISIPFAVIALLIVIFSVFVKPRIENFLHKQIVSFLEDKFQLHVEMDHVKLSLFPPRGELINVQIKNAEVLNMGLSASRIDRIMASLDVFDLLAAQLSLSEVRIDGIHTNVDLDQIPDSGKKLTDINLTEYFEMISPLPITRVLVNKSTADIQSSDLNLNLLLEVDRLVILKNRNAIRISLDVDNTSISYGSIVNTPISLKLSGLWQPDFIEIEKLQVGALRSYIETSGIIRNPRQLLTAPKMDAEIEAVMNLNPVGRVLKVTSLNGELKLNADLKAERWSELQAEVKAHLERLAYGSIQIGQIDFTSQFNNWKVSMPALSFTNEAALLDLKDLKVDLKSFFHNGFKDLSLINYSFDFENSFFDLNSFLTELEIGPLDLELFMDSKGQCQNSTDSRIALQCQVQLAGHELEVRSGPSKKQTIVALEEATIRGNFTLDSEKFVFDSEMQLFNNKGQIKGYVAYKTGFDIQFKTPALDFKNIRNLANLKLEGIAEAEGFTKGDSSSAIFQMQLNSKNTSLQDFFLGDVKTGLSYSKGNLVFSEMNGQINNTTYQTQVDLDLRQNQIRVNLKSPQVMIPDLLRIFERQAKLTLPIEGRGTLTAEVWGPLELSGMSFTADSEFKTVKIGPESFDSLKLKAAAKDGHITAQDVFLTKNSSKITLSGESQNTGALNFKVESKNLKLEESDLINQLFFSVSGLMMFDAQIGGTFLDPTISLNGQMNQLQIQEANLDDSQFKVAIDDQRVKAELFLWGQKVIADINYPISKKEKMTVSLITQNWDFTPFLSSMTESPINREYFSKLSSQVQLQSETGGLADLKGLIKVSDFLLQRNNLRLENKNPMSIIFNENRWDVHNFRIEDTENLAQPTYMELTSAASQQNEVQLNLDGTISLRLLHIFLPFLEDLNGSAKLNLQVFGQIQSPQILGTAAITNGYVKIPAVPHAFENILADIQFSQSQFFIQKISSQFAGGKLTADGQISLAGYKNLPIQLKARMEGVSLNIPDKIVTGGYGDLVISGQWFPYKLSGVYHVMEGSVTKEFGDESVGPQLQASSLLPDSIKQGKFSPLELDMQVIIERPLTVQNSLMDGAMTGQLQILGSPSAPEILGRLNGGSATKLMFKDKVFEANSLSLNFNQRGEINPELYIAARTRVTDYDISLLVQGTAKAPTIRMTSLPPLPESDIISLLALGLTTQKLEKKISSRQQEDSTVTELASAAFSNLSIAKTLQKNLGVEIQINSQYDDTKNTTKRKVTLSRKMSDRVSTTASRNLEDQITEVKLQYLINNNVSAIGSFERREQNENNDSTAIKKDESILGLDLEFKKEFR